jgi:hypothetical protein
MSILQGEVVLWVHLRAGRIPVGSQSSELSERSNIMEKNMNNKFGLWVLVILGLLAIAADLSSEASLIRRLFRQR